MGSPAFAVPSLRALATKFDVVGVVTQPDRHSGRGRALLPPDIKTVAVELNIPYIQPEKIRDEEAMRSISHWQPDMIVVAAYGQILSQNILDLAPAGSINVHASLLPRWRGAAPIQASILHGDTETGITIMLMDAGMDTGPILSQQVVQIGDDETAGELSIRLSHIGADLLMNTLPGFINGTVHPTPQNDEDATYAPLLRKSDGLIDFTIPAAKLCRQVRAFEPWPSSFFQWQQLRIVVRKAISIEWKPSVPGSVIEWKGLPGITTSEGLFILEQIQPAGKKSMPAEDFLRGSPSFIGSHLS